MPITHKLKHRLEQIMAVITLFALIAPLCPLQTHAQDAATGTEVVSVSGAPPSETPPSDIQPSVTPPADSGATLETSHLPNPTPSPTPEPSPSSSLLPSIEPSLAPDSSSSSTPSITPSASSTTASSPSSVDTNTVPAAGSTFVLQPGLTIDQQIQSLDARTKATIKAQEIAKIHAIARTERRDISIEVRDIESIEGGVQCYARAWGKDGKAIGFGKDGSVEWERFRIINPPILVEDPTGSIVRTWADPTTKATKTRRVREDLREALLQSLEHTISVKKEKFDDKNIVPGKQGHTTSTFYPDADPETNSVDGVTLEYKNESWAALIAEPTGLWSNDDAAEYTVVGFRDGIGAGNFDFIFRSMFLFYTASIPSDNVIDSATLSLYGMGKYDNSPAQTPDINIYAATPNSNTAVTDADLLHYGTTEFATAIAYADWNAAGYNDFTLNESGIAAIAKGTGAVSKFGARNPNYDVSGSSPTSGGGNGGYHLIQSYFADQSGTAEDPTLVVESSAVGGPTAPTELLTDGQTNPTGVTSTSPAFSAIYNDPDTGDTATSYQLQVSASSTSWDSPVWDSGRSAMASTAQGSRSPDISYGGTALALNGSTYYWRIKFWDASGAEGEFSTSTASFQMAASATPFFQFDTDRTLTTDLVSYFNLSDPNDSYGSNNFTASGSPTFEKGIIGSALQQGTNNTTKYLSQNVDLCGSGNVSVSLWLKWNSTAVNAAPFSCSSANGKVLYTVYYDTYQGGRVYVDRMRYPLDDAYAIWNHSFTAGTWHHIVFTYDGSTLKLFGDGDATPKDTASVSTSGNAAPPNQTRIGREVDYGNGGGNYYGDMMIDEVGVWHRALSAPELSDLWHSSIGDFFGVPASTSTVVYVSGTISSATTWSATSVYVINGPVTVDQGARLTINAGTVVKFRNDYNTGNLGALVVNGSLNAQGTEGNEVYFTSYKDDSVGGDTDASSATPLAGDWYTIQVNTDASATFTHAIVRYGGHSTDGIIYENGGNVTLDHADIAASDSYGVHSTGGNLSMSDSNLHGLGAYGVHIPGNLYSALTLINNSFHDNSGGAVYINVNPGLAFTHSENNASGAGAGFIMTGGSSEDQTWTSSTGDLPYIVDSLTVGGGTLTIDPGAVLKFYQPTSKLTVSGGTLNAQGTSTATIYFTSYKDDDADGLDTDATSASPIAGDWDTIEVDSGTATIAYAVIRYGGHGGDGEIYNAGGWLTATSTEIAIGYETGIKQISGTSMITSSHIHGFDSGSGAYLSGGTLTISDSQLYDLQHGVETLNPGPSDLTLNDNAFSASNDAAHLNVGYGLTFTHSKNTASGTGAGFFMSGTTSEDQTWGSSTGDLPYIVDSVTVGGGTLTIDPGAVLKFYQSTSKLTVSDGAVLNAQGTPTSTIYFTSYKDDSVGGDTNNAGSPSSANFQVDTDQTLKTSLFSYFNLSDPNDSYGSNNFTPSGPPTYEPALIGNGLQQGTSNTTKYLSQNVDLCGSGNVSVSLWLKWNSTAVNAAPFSCSSADGKVLYTVYYDTFPELYVDRMRYNVDDAYAFWRPGSITQGLWYHVVFTYDGSTLKIYGNGDTTPEDTASVSGGGNMTPVNQTRIGREVDGGNGGGTYYGDMMIDEVGVWHKALSESHELSDLWNSGKGDSFGVSPQAGDWDTIQFNSGASGTIAYAVVRYGGSTSASSKEIYNNGGDIDIEHAEIATSARYGIFQADGTAYIAATAIHHNSNESSNGTGIYVGDGALNVNSSDIYANDYGIYLDGSLVAIADNALYSNKNYALYNGTGSAVTAHNNFWGAWTEPGQCDPDVQQNCSDHVYGNVDYYPWRHSTGYWAVRDNALNWYGGTEYADALDAGIFTWNSTTAGAGIIPISATSVSTTSEASLIVKDVIWNEASPPGQTIIYLPGSSVTDTIQFNKNAMNAIKIDHFNNDEYKAIWQNVTTHELGHALGLGHSDPVEDAIMYHEDSTRTQLAEVDKDDYNFNWTILWHWWPLYVGN